MSGASMRDPGGPLNSAASQGSTTQQVQRRPPTHEDTGLAEANSTGVDLERFVQLEEAIDELTSQRSPTTQQRLYTLMSQCRDAYLRAAGGQRRDVDRQRRSGDVRNDAGQASSPRGFSASRGSDYSAPPHLLLPRHRAVESYRVLHGGPVFQLPDIPLVIASCGSLFMPSFSSSSSLGGGFAVGGCDGVVRFFDASSRRDVSSGTAQPAFSLFGDVRLPTHSAICSLYSSALCSAEGERGAGGGRVAMESSAARWLACGTANGFIELLVYHPDDSDSGAQQHPSPSSLDTRSFLGTDELSSQTPLNERTARWAAQSDSTLDARRVVEPVPIPSFSGTCFDDDVEPLFPQQQQQQQRHDFPSLMAAIAAQQQQQHELRGGSRPQRPRFFGDSGVTSADDDLSGLSRDDRWSSTSSDFNEHDTAGDREAGVPVRGPRRVNSMILSDAGVAGGGGGGGGGGDGETAPMSQRSDRSNLSPLGGTGEGLSPPSRDLAAAPGGRGALKHVRTLRCGGGLSANGQAVTDRVTTLCAASLDGRLLFSGDRRGQCSFWDVEAGTAVSSADAPSSRGSVTQSLLVDTNTVAVGTSSGSVLWLDRRSPSSLRCGGCSAVLLSGTSGDSGGGASSLRAGWKEEQSTAMTRLGAAGGGVAGGLREASSSSGPWNAALRRLRTAGGEALASLQRIVDPTTFARLRHPCVRSLCFAQQPGTLGAAPLLLCATSDGLVRLLDVRRLTAATTNQPGAPAAVASPASSNATVVAAMDLKRRIRSVHVVPSSSSSSCQRLIATFEKDLIQLVSYDVSGISALPPLSPAGGVPTTAATLGAVGARAMVPPGHPKVCCEIRVKGVHEGNACLASALLFGEHRGSGRHLGSGARNGGDVEWDEGQAGAVDRHEGVERDVVDVSGTDVLHVVRGCSGGVLSDVAFYPQY